MTQVAVGLSNLFLDLFGRWVVKIADANTIICVGLDDRIH